VQSGTSDEGGSKSGGGWGWARFSQGEGDGGFRNAKASIDEGKRETESRENYRATEHKNRTGTENWGQ